MSDFLRQMAESSRQRVAAVVREHSPEELDKPVYPLRLAGFDVIAEIKHRSPAEGELAEGAGNRRDRARTYVRGGAAAISVLTEPDRFDGDLEHLAEVVAAAGDTPVMRKDFLVDPVQILEARAAGASGVLLIAAMLNDRRLPDMLDCALDHDLFVLLEAFDEVDLERSTLLLQRARYRDQAEKNKLLVGVNTRNLRTLAVDPTRLMRFGPLLPPGVTCVAESGQHTGPDAARAASWGYKMSLVGTALMRAGDPAALIVEMLENGRAA
jgi:indole-3-glycerol phosphate synthase